MTALVGGVGELFQGDLDLGRHAAETLAGAGLPDVLVEDLYYGALAVTQRLEELRPSALILIGAQRQDSPPGSITRRRARPKPTTEQVAAALACAGTGYVGIDLILDVAAGLGALPARTVVFTVEPSVLSGEDLSAAAVKALGQVVESVVNEVRRLALLEVADQIAERLPALGEAPAVDQIRELLDALATLEESGRWAGAFSVRDRLRLAIAAGQTPEDMEHLDWALWWALIEELDRLEAAEVGGLADLVGN